MLKLFTEHPASVGETYLEHMRSALSFAASLGLAAAACAIHAVFPFVFKHTGSTRVAQLFERMVHNRQRTTDRQGARPCEPAAHPSGLQKSRGPAHTMDRPPIDESGHPMQCQRLHPRPPRP